MIFLNVLYAKKKKYILLMFQNIFQEVSQHIPSGFSISTISSFKSIESKHDVYRCKDCMRKFCEFLREHAMKIIIFFLNEIINRRAAGII